MKLVIVGGVASGASAAARARRLSEDAEIVVLERGPDVSFANCGLPYYVGGEIAPRDELLVANPQLLRERFRLDVRTRSSVEAIDRQGKKVRVKELDTGREYDEAYDALILAPGAAPLRPPIPGIDLPNVLTLRNLEDVDRIKARVDAAAKRVVVVGAGFIGLELAENFVKRGVETVVVELQTQVLPPLDQEMTVPIAEAVGDAVEIRDVVTGAAAILRGDSRPAARYRGTQGTSIVGVFDRVAAITGASEKVLSPANVPYRKIYVHQWRQPSTGHLMKRRPSSTCERRRSSPRVTCRGR